MPDQLEYQKRKAKDKCVDCPNKPELGKVRCRKCLKRITDYRKHKSASGLCICGEPTIKARKQCATCLQKSANKARERRATNKLTKEQLEQASIRNINHRSGVKYVVLSHYSKGEPVCSCCGEKIIDMLTIDHISGGGNKHRKEVCDGRGGTPFYRWLINHRFLEGFRVLCYNCNISASRNGGICQHVAGVTLDHRNTQEQTNDNDPNDKMASSDGLCLR